MENIIIYIVMASVKARLPGWYKELREGTGVWGLFSSPFLHAYTGLIRGSFPSSLQYEAFSNCVLMVRLLNFWFSLSPIAHRDNSLSLAEALWASRRVILQRVSETGSTLKGRYHLNCHTLITTLFHGALSLPGFSRWPVKVSGCQVHRDCY